jgi:cytochrome c oxidase subunit IV
MSEVVVSRKTYILVWLALMCLTVLTAGVSYINLGEWSGFVAILIASVKALLVALFFMHLRYEHQKMAWIVALAGFFWLSILFGLSMTDYTTRNFLQVPGK